MSRGPAESPIGEREKYVVNLLLVAELKVGNCRGRPRMFYPRAVSAPAVYTDEMLAGPCRAEGSGDSSASLLPRTHGAITFSAASMYISSKTGGVESTSPILSNP